MKKVRIISTVLVFCLLVVASSGIVQAANPKLTVWFLATFIEDAEDLLKKQVQEFARMKNVDIDLVFVSGSVIGEKLPATYAAGSPPDIWVNNDPFSRPYITRGLTLETGDVVAELKSRGSVFERLLTSGMKGGKYFGLPTSANLTPLYSRIDLIEAVGETVPTTYEDFARVARKVNKPPNLYAFGLGFGGGLSDGEVHERMMLWSFGGSLFREDGSPATGDAENAANLKNGIQYISDLYKKDKVIPPGAATWDNGGNNNAYQSRLVAFTMNAPSIYWWMTANDDDLLAKTAITATPSGPLGQGIVVDTWNWNISYSTENPELAKELLLYLYEIDRYNEFVKSGGGRFLPLYADLFQDPFWVENPYFKDFPYMLERATFVGNRGLSSAVSGQVFTEGVVTRIIEEVLLKNLDIDDALVKMDEWVQRLWAE